MTAKLPLPDSQPTELETATLQYPKSDFWRGVVRGALHELTFPFLWEDGVSKEDTLARARDIEMSLQEFAPVVHGHPEYATPDQIHLYGVLHRWAGYYGADIANLAIYNTWFAPSGITAAGDPLVASTRGGDSELYIEETGYYRIQASMAARNGDAGARAMYFGIFRNGSLVQQMANTVQPGATVYLTAERDYYLLNADDYLQVQYYQNAVTYNIYRALVRGHVLGVTRVA